MGYRPYPIGIHEKNISKRSAVTQRDKFKTFLIIFEVKCLFETKKRSRIRFHLGAELCCYQILT